MRRLREDSRKKPFGVTLIEMVVVISILAIALTAVTQMLSRNTLSGAYAYDETKAIG